MSMLSLSAALRRALPPLAALLFLCLAAVRPAQAGPTSLTYTGQLLSSTSPPTAVANGLYDMQFKLYTAATGGGQAGPTIALTSVPVASGVFYVQLNFGNIFSGSTYWIETSYRPAGGTTYTVISPRPIAPNSAFADYATLSGNTQALQGKGISVTAPTTGQLLTYNGSLWTPAAPPTGMTYTAGSGLALTGSQFSVAVPLALSGSSSSPILSAANSSSGYGVAGSSTSGIGGYFKGGGSDGVYGQTTAAAGFGVYGEADTGAGAAGVYGTSTSGYGVAGSGAGFGVYGTSSAGSGVYGNSTSGYGVYGTSAGGGASGYFTGGAYDGLYAETTASSGNGILGEANTGASAYGVEGYSTSGYGVVGSGAGTGVYGLSSAGKGVYAYGGGTSVSNPALLATNSNPSGIAIYSTSNSSDANLVITNAGTGDLIKAFNGGNNLYFEVKANGTTVVRQLQITGGADLAEPYTVGASEGVTPLPGMVVSIDPDHTGQMTLAHEAYDRTVAGIVSGAGGIETGLTLRQKGSVADGGLPIACTGRVWCFCDANANGAIRPGDLLTTSATPGHAMKATDDRKQRGAILGKAMSSLPSGKGLVLVLVTLQ